MSPLFALLLGLLLVVVAIGLLWFSQKPSETYPHQDDERHDEQHAGDEQYGESDVTPDVEPHSESYDEGYAEQPTSFISAVSRRRAPSERKQRKAWAQDRGLEYIRSDADIAETFGEQGTLTDVVSGFYRAHELNIGDMGSRTIMAIRREAASPVEIHWSTQDVDQTLRRAELLDLVPFAVATSDVRALDRMVDSRVIEAVEAFAEDGTVAQLRFREDWLLLDVLVGAEYWQEMLPYVKLLLDASMVLPPMNTVIPLDLSLGDRTRPLPGEVFGDHSEGDLSDSFEASGSAKNVRDTAVRGSVAEKEVLVSHIHPVPSADSEPVGRHARERLIDNPGENPVRPEVIRPADPVLFPSRSQARNLGDTGSFQAFTVEEPDPDSAVIPPIGENPDHSVQSEYADVSSRVIRSPAPTTIFTDATVESEHDSSEEQSVNNVSQFSAARRKRPGKHRAVSSVESSDYSMKDYETVDGEIVHPDEL